MPEQWWTWFVRAAWAEGWQDVRIVWLKPRYGRLIDRCTAHTGWGIEPYITLRIAPHAPEKMWKWIMLHELAHILNYLRKTRDKPHGLPFWRIALYLYRLHGVYTWVLTSGHEYKSVRAMAKRINAERRQPGYTEPTARVA
jgi:hypothetical protein